MVPDREQDRDWRPRFVFERSRLHEEELTGEVGQRLRELDAKLANNKLNPEEFDERRRILEEHTETAFFEGPEYTDLGVTDPEQFRENLGIAYYGAEEAYEAGCWFEALSLRMLHLDFMLRTYIVHKGQTAIKPFSKEDRRSFGKVVEEAKNLGLSDELANDLWAFSEERNNAIHHFALGLGTYQDVGDTYRDADGLVERIAEAMDLPPAQ